MKINSNVDNSLPFGWYITIHNNITKKVGMNLGFSPDLLKKFAYYSKRPDMDEIFIFRQKHYFFPNKGRSFLDITKTRNAKYAYKKHLEKMQQAFSVGKKEKAIKEAGRALHYLQDMSQPHHIEEGSFFQKVKSAIYPHIVFENKIHRIQDSLYEHTKNFDIEAQNFEELFKKTIDLSQKTNIPKSTNKDSWENIGQSAINITIASTKKFFELIKKYF